MSKRKIILIDPAYFNKYSVSFLTVPLGIGYLSSYITNCYGEDNVSISIYKNPDSALKDIRSIKPDIVGLSLFYWNASLVKLIIKRIRQLYGKNVCIVLGGQSIDDLPDLQNNILLDTGADALIPGEGELGFSNLVKHFISSTYPYKLYPPLDGVIYHPFYNIEKKKSINFDTDLSNIPSPYLNGNLDKFLNGTYQPIIQTSRLCPYTCVFCTVGKNNGKLRAFDLNTVSDEIEYIADRMKKFPIKTLLLSDDNFGIFDRDEQIAEFIVKANEKYGYPKSVYFYSDKNFTESSKNVVKILKNLSSQGLAIALQSDNIDTLKAVKRKNLSSEKIDAAIQWASENNIHTTTELLFGLPFETKDSFTQSMAHIVQKGIDSVLCHNVFVLPGSEMDRPYYRQEHRLKTKYRLLATNYAEIEGNFAAEVDEVVIGSKDFGFDDFLVIRQLNFMFYTVFTLDFYKWFFQLLRLENIDIIKIFSYFMNPDPTMLWPSKYLNFIDDFNNAIKDELFDTKEEVIKHAKKCWDENAQKVGEPTRINVLFGARIIYMEDWVYDVLLTIFKFVSKDKNILNKVKEILLICKNERIDLRNLSPKKSIQCSYNLNDWKKSKFKKNIDHFYTENTLVSFELENDAKESIIAFNNEFGYLKNLDYYYNALDIISPRHKTLHKLEMLKSVKPI